MRRKTKPLNDEVMQFVRENYIGVSARKMSKITLEKFGIGTVNQIERFYKDNHLKSGLTGRYEKGRIAENKGRPAEEWMTPKQMEIFKSNQFKKGTSTRDVPVGSKSVHSGTLLVKVGDKDWRIESHMVWERYHGKIPDGYQIVHIDGNFRNNDISNLQALSPSEIPVVIKNLTDSPDINRSVVALGKLRARVREIEKNGV